MPDSDSFEITIATDGTPIDVRALNDFLYHFRAAYAAAVEMPGTGEGDFSIPRAQELAAQLHDRIRGSDWRSVYDLAYKDLQGDQLGIVHIVRENPLRVSFKGMVLAIVVAVIVSGGEIELGPVKAELPPLGEGIAALRAAFHRGPSLILTTDAPKPRGGPSR